MYKMTQHKINTFALPRNS